MGVHSDVITDGIVDLVDHGAVTGAIVGSLAMGRRRLYDFLDGNPRATLEPIERVADATRLGVLPALVSVTKAFAIDLSGQVCGAHTRVLVPRARYDEVVDAAAAAVDAIPVGDPHDPATIVGPLVPASAASRARGSIRPWRSAATGSGAPRPR